MPKAEARRSLRTSLKRSRTPQAEAGRRVTGDTEAFGSADTGRLRPGSAGAGLGAARKWHCAAVLAPKAERGQARGGHGSSHWIFTKSSRASRCRCSRESRDAVSSTMSWSHGAKDEASGQHTACMCGKQRVTPPL